MVIIYPRNVPSSGFVNRNLCNCALAVKNATRGSEKVPSTAAKKKFAAKLRKIRWRIYRDIDLNRGNIIKSLKYYQKQVQLFLKDFSKKLKPEEPSIWMEKITKTSDDVHAFKRNKKMKAQVCVNCSAHYVGGHFIRANNAALNNVEGNEVLLNNEAKKESLDNNDMAVEDKVDNKKSSTFFKGTLNEKKEVEAEYYDVKIGGNESGDDIVATARKESKFWQRIIQFLYKKLVTNPIPANKVEELFEAISCEASSRGFKKGYVMMNAKKAEGVYAADDENDKSTAATVTIKEEVAASSSKPSVFKPVDWTKCLK